MAQPPSESTGTPSSSPSEPGLCPNISECSSTNSSTCPTSTWKSIISRAGGTSNTTSAPSTQAGCMSGIPSSIVTGVDGNSATRASPSPSTSPGTSVPVAPSDADATTSSGPSASSSTASSPETQSSHSCSSAKLGARHNTITDCPPTGPSSISSTVGISSVSSTFSTTGHSNGSGAASSSSPTSSWLAGTTSRVPVQDSTTTDRHRDHTSAIVGGVLGGLAFLLLITIATILLRRRLRARRTAPSAEFMDIARNTPAMPGRIPTPAFARVEGSATPSGDRLLPLPLGDDGHGHDEEHPPLFTPGAYVDPVFEKVRAAAAMREEYEGRSSTAHGHEPEEESAASEVYEDCRSSTVYDEDGIEKGYGLDGEEKGYGVGGDEKFGEYAWAM